MQKRAKIAIAAAAVAAAAAAGGVGISAASGGGDDSEPSLTGDTLQRATDAALAETGGGRVTGTEAGDEESYYEVEVTLDDGSQVDVQLDRDFNVVGSEADGHEDEGGADDD
jgi:uncharacterized membrane protein YkoI